MSKTSADGRPWRRLRKQILERDRYVCWLCGHPGADSVDHEIPVSVRPDLKMDSRNLRAAHLNPCNSGRGARMTGPREPTSRRW